MVGGAPGQGGVDLSSFACYRAKMIKDRPEVLLADPSYSVVPPLPYKIDWGFVPEQIKLTMLTLDGIQPITTSRALATDGITSSIPSSEEIEYYKRRKSEFQLVFVVASCLYVGRTIDGASIIKPFAFNLIPSTKRGKVSTASLDFVIDVGVGNPLLHNDCVYTNYNPFTGAWGLFSESGILIGNQSHSGFMDEIGIVTDHYFIEINHDREEVCAPNFGINDTLFERYCRHRANLLFKPFTNIRSRRIWGVETPIEMFFLQSLYRHHKTIDLQTMIFNDGSRQPSIYDLWSSLSKDEIRSLITEADFFIPDKSVAVFCDGSHHLRKKQRDRDAQIDEKLRTVGITPVRVSGREIVKHLDKATNRVMELIA